MKPDIASFEPDIVRIGRALAERAAGQSPALFERRWWSNALLDWAMKDETFKVRLFRFVDVLPAVADDTRLATLIEEYFGNLTAPAGVVQWGMRLLSSTKLGARMSSGSMRQQILNMAKLFIAGVSPEDAEPALAGMWKEGRTFSVDLLGEACVAETEADRYRDQCVAAMNALAKATATWPATPLLERDHLGPIPRVNLSVKLSALYSQLDPIDPEGSYEAVAARLRPLLDLGRTLPASITFDMEQAEFKDLVLSIFMRILTEEPYRS